MKTSLRWEGWLSLAKITQDVAGRVELLSCQVSELTSRNVAPDNLHLCIAATQRLSLEERTAAAAAGETPLTLAVKAGLTQNVKTLLEHGASPHNTNGKNETPLLLGKDENLAW